MLGSTAITLLRIPVGAWAAAQFGTTGLWWTLALTAAARGVLMARLWASGRWRRGRRVTVLTSHTDDLESYGASRRPERLVMRGHRQRLSTRISPGERSGQVNRIERAERSWEGLCRPP